MSTVDDEHAPLTADDDWRYRVVCHCREKCPEHYFRKRVDAIGHCLNRDEWPQVVLDVNDKPIYATTCFDGLEEDD